MRKNALVELLQETIATLGDPDAPYVYRRDAADLLGRAAAHAVMTLKSHEDEKDPDVHIAVHQGLREAQAALEGTAPRPLEKEGHTLEQLARACEKKGKRTVAPHGEGYAVDVAIGDARRQRVLLLPAKGQGGQDLVRIVTICGPPNEKVVRWALRNNLQFVHGALALSDEDGQEKLVMACSFVAGQAEPDEIKAAVKEIAFYADWIEARLSGKDVY